MSKNLDEILKAKTSAIEAEKAEQAAQAEAEAVQGIEAELAQLAKTKRDLEIVQESISTETSGRSKAQRSKKTAESAIDAKSKQLMEVGLTKEQLLTDPEYEDVQEVQELRQASEEADLYSTPSVGTPELFTKLTSMGIEVPADATESDILAEIHSRVAAIDREMIAKRLEIPGERTKIATELLEKRKLISPEKLKLFSADVRVARNAGSSGTLVEKAYDRLNQEISSISELESQPALRESVMEQYMREFILAEEKSKSEYEAQQERSRTGDDRKRLITPYDVYIDRRAMLETIAQQKENGERPSYGDEDIAHAQNVVESYERKLDSVSGQVSEYARLRREQEQQKPAFFNEGSDKHRRDHEGLTKALAALAGYPGETAVQLDDEYYTSSFNREKVARLILPDAEKKHKELITKISEKRSEKERAEQSVRSIGPKPSGLFSSGAQKRWEAEKSAAEGERARIGRELEGMEADARSMVTMVNLGSLPPEVVQELRDKDASTVADVAALLREAVPAAQTKEGEAQARERDAADLKQKLERVGKEQLTFY